MIVRSLAVSSVALVHFAFAAIAAEPHGLPGPTIPDGLGVNIHFTTPQPGELEMLRDGGIRFVRMDFAWSGIERKRGEYDFSAYDKLMAALDKEQIRAIFILDYGNAMYDGGDSPRSDEGREGFARWVVAALTHFQGRGIVWEMWNEPNIAFWKPKPDAAAYAKLAVTVGKAIRGTPAIAHELYIGPAVSTIDLKFLETCFQAGCLKYWDAVSVHPYRQDPGGPKSNHAGDPESVLADYARIRGLSQKYAPGKTIPIVSGEWGYSSGWNAYDPDRQGKMLPRQWLVNLVSGRSDLDLVRLARRRERCEGTGASFRHRRKRLPLRPHRRFTTPNRRTSPRKRSRQRSPATNSPRRSSAATFMSSFSNSARVQSELGPFGQPAKRGRQHCRFRRAVIKSFRTSARCQPRAPATAA